METANVVFRNTKVNLASQGMRHLGAVTGNDLYKEKYVSELLTKIHLEINRFVNFCHLVITKARRLQHLVAITKADGTIFIKNT